MVVWRLIQVEVFQALNMIFMKAELLPGLDLRTMDCIRKICIMLLKPEVYKKDVKLDYVAMEIPNKFIVGFGLDYNELGRNYKDIYVLDED